MNYHAKLTWKQGLSDNVVEHHDGVVSMLATWDGYRVDLEYISSIKLSWLSFRDALHVLSDK